MSKLINKAKKEERNGNLEVALTYYEMALSDSSCPYDIRCDMGTVYNKLNNFNEGLNCFETVLNMDKNHFDSLFGMGISLLGLNKWYDALDYFLKCIEMDNTNANSYYYSAMILKNNDDNTKAQEYYSRFLKLDNDEFEQIRSNYNFGLIFLNTELGFDNKCVDNINEFEEVLNLFNINNDEIDYYLKTLPYEKLISKINELNEIAHLENEKKIIRNIYLEMGFSDDDIDDYFIIDGHDVLKEDIIKRTNDNPFPDKIEINIPLDIKEKDHGYKLEEIYIKEKSNKSIKNKKRIKDGRKPVKRIYNLIYSFIKKEIRNKDFETAKNRLDLIDESKIPNEMFRVNFICRRALILSYLDSDSDKILDDLNCLEKEYPEITSDKNYVYNKKIIKSNLDK